MDPSERVTGEFELNISGERLVIRLNLPTTSVKPHRVLPLFQQMTNSFVDVSVKAAEAKAKQISCKPGCCACCIPPVPISELEVYQIAELVESMAEPRRSEIKKRFADACSHFRSIGWFDRIAACDEMGKKLPLAEVARELQMAVNEYFFEGIPCPFLEGQQCSIHSARPLVCREHLVTSPPENCSRINDEPVDGLDLVVSPSRTVQHIGRTNRVNGLGFIPLIRALELAERFPENYKEKETKYWVQEFFDRLSGRHPVKEEAISRSCKGDSRRRKSKGR